MLCYLIGDLFLFDGPINRRIQSSDPNSPAAIAKAKANGVVARVFNHQITRTQLNRAIHERLWLEGKKLEDITPAEIKLVEYAALGDLIDQQLIRVKVMVNTDVLTVSKQEIDERLDRFIQTFSTKDQLLEAMEVQGIPDLKNLRNRIAARIQQEKYVALRVDPQVEVSDEEIQDFYESNLESLKIPERVQARHIFLPTLNTPSEEAKARLEKVFEELNKTGSSFSELAQKFSMDPATKSRGGDLGWMSEKRVTPDFAKQVFELETGQPKLIQTKIGWHLVEVTDRKPETQPSLEDQREEIRSAILTTKRHQATNDFRTALRQFEKEKIDIFHDQLAQ